MEEREEEEEEEERDREMPDLVELSEDRPDCHNDGSSPRERT